MRILVLSSVFPNPKQPTFGTFVHARVARMAARHETVVVAPIPWFPLNRLFRGAARSGIPRVESQGTLTVHHPKILSVPGVLKVLDGIFYFASVLPTIARIRRRFPFDVIDAHFAYPDGLAAWLLGKVFRCPVTVTLRGTIVPLSRYRLRRIQIRWVLAGVNRIFAVSDSLKAVAVGLGTPGDKIRVIPNGVDTARFGPASSAEARQALGLPPDRRILLSVGTLSPRKGHQRVIDVLPHIRATHPDLLYVVLGGPGVEGDTGPLLERLIAQHGLRDHVRLLGAQPHEEVPRWLAAADLFCLATTNEGRANVILEALACGVPVVTTDVGGSREVIADGMDGLLVAPGDPAALTAALLRALSMGWDREAIARRAAGRTWEQTVDDLSEELGALAGAPTPAFTDASPGSPRR